jgi:hypothetical protein
MIANSRKISLSPHVSFTTLLNIPAAANPHLSCEELPEFAEGLPLSALAFEFAEEDSLKRDWMQKSNA